MLSRRRRLPPVVEIESGGGIEYLAKKESLCDVCPESEEGLLVSAGGILEQC